MTKNNINNLKGFTRIGLLVVLSMMLILTGTTAYALNAVQKSKQVKTVAENVRVVIAETRSYAMANPNVINSGTKEIDINMDMTNGIKVLANGTDDITSKLSLSNVKFPVNVKLGASSYSVKVNCADRNYIGQLMSGSAKAIVISNKDGSDAYTVNINDYGYASVTK